MKTLLLISVSIAIISFLYYKNIRQYVKPKNVVVIMADDLGFNDVSYRGSNEFQTPNIDALAYHGIILDRYEIILYFRDKKIMFLEKISQFLYSTFMYTVSLKFFNGKISTSYWNATFSNI